MTGLWLWTGVAIAGMTVVPEHRSALLPGHVGTVLVAVTTGSGEPDDVWPAPQVEGAMVQDRERVRAGLWRVKLGVPAEAIQVRMQAGSSRAVVPVRVPPAPRFAGPVRVDTETTAARVTIALTGRDLPSVEGLGVWLPEGAVESVREVDDGLAVTVALSGRAVPRIVPVGFRNLALEEQAVWTRIHVRAKVPLAIAAEPGARLTLEVSGRPYGPFVADAAGTIRALVDQYPGETSALGRIEDDLGNQSEARLLLGGQAGAVLSLLAEGDYVAGGAPPLAHLFASSPGGTPLAAAPRCTAGPGSGAAVAIGTVPVSPGRWMVALPESETAQQITCTASDGGSATLTVPRAREVPRALRLRVSPVDLRSDLPVSEIRVELEDGVGDPMPLDNVTLTARSGEIRELRRDVLLRAEYDGTAAASSGGDVIIASYQAPPGTPPAREVQLGWGQAPSIAGGAMVVYVRALDRRRRPLVGIPLRAEAFGATHQATAGPAGWGEFTVAVPEGYDVIPLTARVGSRLANALVHRGERGASGPPSADLRQVRQVRIQPGRTAAINVDVEPTVLRNNPGAVALVQVNLEDDAGRSIVDETVTLRATEGTVSDLTLRADGTYSARYSPNADTRRREVRITAETASMRSSTQLLIEPPAVRAAIGPWVGLMTNFGPLSRWVAGLDVDLRAKRFVARLGVHVNQWRLMGLEGGEVRSLLVPFSLSALVRDDRGPFAFWGGAGVSAGPHLITATDAGPLATGTQLVAGPLVQAGVARRAPGGEVAFTLRYHLFLGVTPGGALSYDDLGGLAAGVGYRLVY